MIDRGPTVKDCRVVTIILNYNRAKDTIECAQSVLESTLLPTRVLVFDNGSDSHCLREIKDGLADRVDIIGSSKNLGVASAWNRSIAHAEQMYGPHFVFLVNNDTVVQETVIEELVSYALENGLAGALAPTVLQYAPPNDFYYSEYESIESPIIDFALCGCALMLRVDVIGDVGYFDEDYFAYGEETDFLRRMSKSNWGAYYVPTSGKVYHKGGVTSSMMPNFEVYHRTRGMLLFALKNSHGIARVKEVLLFWVHVLPSAMLQDFRLGIGTRNLKVRIRGALSAVATIKGRKHH